MVIFAKRDDYSLTLTTWLDFETYSTVKANLVFEQSYHEIDGDSASLTGLCALLSALAQQPIYQHLAVTGAVDQFGNVQPVEVASMKKSRDSFEFVRIRA